MNTRIIILSIFLSFLCFCESYAQGAFDSACYFPHLGNPNEIDSIYGGQPNQYLGDHLRVLPRLKDAEYDRLVMAGLPDNIPFLTAVETGPTFNIHDLKINKKFPYVFRDWTYYKTGHFRSPKYIDLLMMNYSNSADRPLIFWADENGEYDSSRYTQLFPEMIGAFRMECGYMFPYIGNFTSDTVDDIILSLKFAHHVSWKDSNYIALVKGGQSLFDQGKIAMWSDTVYWGQDENGPNKTLFHRLVGQGDFRGTGREDFLTADDWGNIFFYKNDRGTFNLHSFLNSLQYDTLISMAEWTLGKHYNGLPHAGPLYAFPKSSSDKSCDFMIAPTVDSGYSPFRFYKGGPSFGSKRIYLDSASDFVMRHPGYYSSELSSSIWSYYGCLGDITGTGNNVMLMSGSQGLGYGYLAFYVLGKALDDKIDLFISYKYGGGSIDTIVATSKGYKSVVWGAPAYESPEDQNNDIHGKGSLRIIYGNERIPVKLNPKFAVAEYHAIDTSRYHLLAYPNPCDQTTVLTFDNCTGGKLSVDVISATGQCCLHEETPGGNGLQQYGLSFAELAAGNYTVRLSCISGGWTTSINIVKTGAAQTSWKLDLKKMVGR